jgi:DNA modification methylase
MPEVTYTPVVEKMRLADIELAEYNPREIADHAFEGLIDSIKGLGLLEVPVVNCAVKPPRCVSGHQRIRALMDDGYEYADCIVVKFDDTTEKTANLTMNNPAVRGHWDASKALPELEDISSKLPKLDSMGFARLQEQIRSLLPSVKKLHHRARDRTPEASDAPKSKQETVYKLGEHRLLCGDIMEPGSLQDLFGKKKAHLCLTDPPYNVDYENYYWEGIDNDKMDKAAWTLFLTAMCKIILSITKGPSYVFCATRFLPDVFESWLMNKGEVHRWVVWAKDAWNLSPADYMHQLDFILYGGRAGVALPKPNRVCTNVLEFKKPKVNALHPCQKPVELVTQLLEDGSQEGQIVFDPFGGSGTTLVAAEDLGRVCYMAEMNPSHCDTIRMRWAEQVHGEDCAWESLTPSA